MLGTASMDGYFTELNPAWERWLGWTCEELMAEPFISFVHPDDVEATLARTAGLAEPDSGSVVAFENRYRTRDGDYRDLQWTTVADHGVLYFVTKDVTEHRAAEAERGARRAADPPLRDAAPDADRATCRTPPSSCSISDLRILVADGEAIKRLPWSTRTSSTAAR